MEMLGTKSVYIRHPEDMNLVLRNQGRFRKSEASMSRLSAWLGNGLASNTDLPNHAVRVFWMAEALGRLLACG
jgi:hypothetical protein